MISLSDSELAAVMEAARTIPSRDRSEFLRDVVVELSKYPELGPGIIGPSQGQSSATSTGFSQSAVTLTH